MRSLLALILLSGCAAGPVYQDEFKFPCEVKRDRYQGYNVITTCLQSVDAHCRKYMGKSAKTDLGHPYPEDRPVPGCFFPGKFGRKGNIYISVEHIGCLGHEVCHAEGKPESVCGERYPCRRYY